MNIVKKIFLCTASGLMLLLTSPASASLILVTAGDQLIGANNIDVNGTFYDVKFLTGTCEEVFGTCSVDKFTFQDQASADEASLALLEQVFIDVPSGLFDSSPELTIGCTWDGFCNIQTPYTTFNGSSGLRFSNSVAQNTDGTDRVAFGSRGLADSAGGTSVFALWSTSNSTAVSAPSTLAIFALGLIGLGALRIKLRKE